MGQENRRDARRYSYRNLDVWKRAQDLAVEVIRLVSGLPRSPATDVLTHQIIRSVSSIGGNIAEGHGRFSIGAFRNHLLIARGSAAETDNWLDLLDRLDMIDRGIAARLEDECDTLVGALTNRVRALDKKANEAGPRLREAWEEYRTDEDSEEGD